MSDRTLRTWIREDAPARPRGRPRTSDERRLLARRLVSREWRRQGRTAGVAPVGAALAGRVPDWLVRKLLAEIKRLHRVKHRRAAADRRLTIDVRHRDVLWSLDATHLGRLPCGAAVEGQVVRETATPLVLDAAPVLPADSDPVIRFLERVAAARGALPLVFASDNGPTYVSADVETWLEEHGVVHLLSLPHTPRHNPWVERTHRELKSEAGLGKGVVLQIPEDARAPLVSARCRLNEARLRPDLGFRTAAAADAELESWYHVCTRDDFRAAVCRRTDEALQGLETARERRVARREAILATLEHFGLIQRTRGGR